MNINHYVEANLIPSLTNINVTFISQKMNFYREVNVYYVNFKHYENVTIKAFVEEKHQFWLKRPRDNLCIFNYNLFFVIFRKY